MSTQITTAFVKEFASGITHDAQQRMSRLRGSVRRDTISSGDRKFYDRLGTTTADLLTVRHGDTPITDTPHSRRMVTPADYVRADLVDTADRLKVLNDPTSAYSQSFAMAFGRRMDQVIIDAAFAAASTGNDGTTTANHPATHQIASASAGMTLLKINEAKKILDESENMGPYIAVVSAEQIEDLMNDSTITSNDYNSVRLLMRGDVDTFGGFRWIRSELLNTVSSERACIFYNRDSLLLASSMEITAKIAERPDKNHSIQVHTQMSIGATRLDEDGVVRVLCTE